MRADIQFATEVLSQAVARTADPEVQFRFALEARSEMRKLLKAGRPPRDNYRYQWVVATTKRLLATLSEWGDEFDQAYPQDVSTMLDMLDVVETAKVNLIRRCKEMGLEVESAEKPETGHIESSVASAVDGDEPDEDDFEVVDADEENES